MNKKLSRIVSGILSLMFVGQVMIYGDGNSQGIAHAETISDIKESLQFSKNADELQKEFENAVGGLGEIDYFASPESGIMMMNEAGEGKAAKASGLKISGKVEKGGQKTADDTPIFVHIFNGDWANVASKEISDGDSFSVEASGSDVYHVKFECDGYLPFYLKDFGTGSYTVGSGNSWDTVTLIPGDTTWNEENDNQWSDDVLNAADSEYVKSCFGATRGDSDFNPSMDAYGDNVISQDDLNKFCDFYDTLENDEYYTLSQYVQDLDINKDGVINDTDYKILEESGVSETELADFKSELDSARTVNSEVYIYNPEMTGDVIVNKEDYEQGLAKINAYAQKRGRSENYFEYMDKNNSGTVENSDVSWFSNAYATYGDLDWDHAFKRNLKVLAGGVFPYSFNLHDTNLDLNGQTISVADCMSFTTDMPQFWSGNGATLDINGGKLLIQNNLVFRTASPDGWGGNTGQLMNLNGGEVYIGNCFDFGQANCYDTILMTNDADRLYVGGNWTYITLTDMEGKWTAGQIRFAGPTWEVNEHSGEKAIYSSGTQSIIFGYIRKKDITHSRAINTQEFRSIRYMNAQVYSIRSFTMRRTMSMTMKCVFLRFRKTRMTLYLTPTMQTETRNLKLSETV